MSNSKISALTGATTPLSGTEVLPIVQSSTTKQVSVANLTAGRAISATSVTASTGNFVVGTSGQGIDFSATPGTGTSELLADYEEGSWTPTIVGTTTAGAATYSLQEGTYTKVGRQVTVNCAVTWTGHTGTGLMRVSGLPFSVRNDNQYSSFIIDAANLTLPASTFPFAQVRPNGSEIAVNSMSVVTGSSSAVAMDAAATLYFQATYFV